MFGALDHWYRHGTSCAVIVQGHKAQATNLSALLASAHAVSANTREKEFSKSCMPVEGDSPLKTKTEQARLKTMLVQLFPWESLTTLPRPNTALPR